MDAELWNALLQPLPLGSKHHKHLDSHVVFMNGMYWLNPEKTLQSTMRALYVMKQVPECDCVCGGWEQGYGAG